MSPNSCKSSRTSCVFAGGSLSGTSLGPDSGANEDLYGKKVSGEEIWAGKVQAPDSAKEMLATLAPNPPRTCQQASSNNNIRNYALQNNQRGTGIPCGATGQRRVVSVCAGFLSWNAHHRSYVSPLPRCLPRFFK